MDRSGIETIQDAIMRHAAAVLSFPTAAGLIHHKTQFLAGDETGLWVVAVGELPLIQRIIDQRVSVGVSFRGGGSRHIFVSPIRRHAPEYRAAIGTNTPAILIDFPRAIQTVQRRSDYRVRVTAESDLTVQCWTIAPGADVHARPSSAQRIPTEIHDLSPGGMGVTFCGAEGQPPRLGPADRLRIELRYQGTELLIEGRVRASSGRVTAGALRTGIRFIIPRGSLKDRQVIAQVTRIVADLRRQETRAHRLAG